MVDGDRSALKIGILVGVGVLIVLFGGWVLSRVAWVLSRAITGATILLLAVGISYVTYQLYNGWQEADQEAPADGRSEFRTTEGPERDIADRKEDYIDGTVDEEELEAELEDLMTDREMEKE